MNLYIIVVLIELLVLPAFMAQNFRKLLVELMRMSQN